MNKTLLFLIIVSGFLVIFYANSELFSRKSLFAIFQTSSKDNIEHNAYAKAEAIPLLQANLTMGLANRPLFLENNRNGIRPKAPQFPHAPQFVVSHNLRRVKYIASQQNISEFNIFVIYTKENYQLQKKFELFAKSLLKFNSVKLHLHIITDSKSEQSAEEILKQQIRHYHKTIYYSLYDVHESAEKVTDIVGSMMPYFSSNPGSYYSDALFYISLGLHRIADPQMDRAILIDCDVVFRTDVRLLFDEFERFSEENLFGLAPELTPVYRHILYRYRANYPNTNFGSPYYPISAALLSNSISNVKHKHKHIKHGYPGLNSGIVLFQLQRIRQSRLYEDNLKEVHVRRMSNKYSFKGHLGDQDFYTLLGYEFPSLIYRLDCVWNRQLCTWWKDHGYSDVFDTYFHCEGSVKLYHGNCNTRVPE